MSKTPKGPGPRAGGPGDNRRAIEEAESASLISHLSKIRAQRVKTAEAKAKLDAEREIQNELFRQAKVDKFSRKELTELLDDMAARTRNLVAEEERRVRLRVAVGLPVATQLDLFGGTNTPDEVQEELAWKNDGHRTGILAGEPKPPEGCPERFVQAWMGGYHDGQAVNLAKMQEAMDSKNAAAAAAKPEGAPKKPARDKSHLTVVPAAEDPRVGTALDEMAGETS